MMGTQCFSFFYIPEHVAKREYTRAEYEGIILKFLLKVKLRYLALKREQLPNEPIEKILITEEDETPNEVLDDVISEIKNKNSENQKTIVNYIKDCKD